MPSSCHTPALNSSASTSAASIQRDGLSSAAQRHQLSIESRPIPPHATLDIKNAHTSIARLAVYLFLAKRYRATQHPLDLTALKTFLCFYSIATLTIIQVERLFVAAFQTDGLDQGNALSQYDFGQVFADFLDAALTPYPESLHTCIHDDVALSALFFISDLLVNGSLPDHPDDSTPLPKILAVLSTDCRRCLRLLLALDKFFILMPRLTAALASHALAGFRPSDYPHLFPANTTFSDSHFKFGGQYLAAATSLLPEILAGDLPRYRSILARATNLPIPAQARLLILSISCRPTVRFGHFFQYAPPSLTRDFALALRHDITAAFETVLALRPGSLAAAPSNMGTLAQFLLPAAQGGVGFDDPLLISASAYLATFASTLDIHLRDDTVSHLVTDPTTWRSAHSRFLVDARGSWGGT